VKVTLDISDKVNLIKDGSVEIITLDELRELFETVKTPRVYWGFECSGYIHLGIGLITGRKMRHFIDAEMELTILLADWHSWINNKFGGDMDKIRIAGEYFIHSFKALGLKGEKVKYLWASELINYDDYWETMIRIAKNVSLNRVIRSLPILGRRETDEIREFAWLIYPLMQATDIFILDVDVAGAGIDQRKAHMLARDVASVMDKKKPIFVHTPLLPSLDSEVPVSKEERIFAKMSKSKPKTAIFIHDDEDTIRRKIRKAYCPPREVERNPLVYLYEYIIFPYMTDIGKKVCIKTKKGDKEFDRIDDMKKEYSIGDIHPLDLKEAAVLYLSQILKPVRKYFDLHHEILEDMRMIVGEKI
jgi:tyrosyl-tRNA synthetase